ncbi:MAG: HYR domain-containing protein [Flavobacteriales bacterium]|nr:HYR domain-containing protein [Flavobacteriales bacterium]
MKKISWLFKTVCAVMLAVMAVPTLSQAQLPDSKGNDFWLAFPRNYTANSPLQLFISSETASSGNVNIPGTGFSTSFTTTPGVTTTVSIPASNQVMTSNGVENKGIHVTSNNEVTIYGLNQISYTTDAYLGMPTDILGTDYMVMSYTGLSASYPSQMTVVATQNATTITVTPSTSAGGHAAGVAFNVSLNQGEVYQLGGTNGADMSGSTITSDKPVAVYGSVVCANVPTTCYACDHLVEQMPPLSAWGKNFVSAPLKNRSGGDVFRILASQNSTSVTVNGAPVATLNKGQVHEMTIATNAVITSNKPVLVAQFARGSSCDGAVADPFMMLIPPYEQFLGSYTVSTPASGFSYHFINLVVPQIAIGNVTLDGGVIPAGSFSAIGASGFYAAQLTVAAGTHNLNSNYPIGVHSYGFGNYDSYGYPGGQSLAPIGFVSSITLAPVNGGTSTVGGQHCVTATVLDQYGNPVSGVRVDFAVTGANNVSGFAFTNASGEASYCYNGNMSGTDDIVATTGSLTSNHGSKTWQCGTVTFTYASAVCDSSNSSSITFTGVSGGVAPISYSINGGTTYSASASFTGLGFGSYDLMVKDAAGCTSATSGVTLADGEAPNAVCKNITVQLDSSHLAFINASDVDGGSTDNCGIASISINKSTFSCESLGANTVILTVVDVNGNSSTCAATVTVKDDFNKCCQGPSAVCQNIAVYLDATGNATISAADVDGGSTAECGLASMTISNSSFNCSNVGPNTVVLTVEDVNGETSTCNAVVTVNDSTPPTVIAQNLTFYLDAAGNASVTANDVDGGSSDACGIASLVLNNGSFTCANVGDNEVVLTATDNNGNAASGKGTITILDSLPPKVVAQNIVVYLNGSGNATITAADVDGGSSDNCGVSLSIDNSSFGCANVGANTVVLTGTDPSGNTASASGTVTVRDSTKPAVIAQDITIFLDATGNATITAADVDGGSSDNCGVSLSIDNSSFGCANVGANTVVLTGTDPSGNTASASGTVTVRDSTKPAVVAQNITIYLDATGNATITAADVDGGSTDNCSIASLSVDRTAFTCGHTGTNIAVLTATDNSGNNASAMSIVTVLDSTAPYISCPGDISVVSTPEDCDPQVSWSDVVAGDNCSYAVSSTHNSGDEFPLGTTTVTYTATDASGNASSCSFNVTVTPQTLTASLSSPTYNGYNISCNGGSNGSISTTVGGGCLPYAYAWSNGAATADVSGLSAGDYQLTVTDASGQSVELSITLTEPSELVADAGNNGTVYYGYQPYGCTSLSASAQGGVPGYSYSWSTGETTASINVCPSATSIYYVTVTDENGCTAVDSATVCVIDVRCEKGGKAIVMYEGGKVMVCHVSGNGKTQTLCISPNAVADHLAHGDALGYCNDVHNCDYVNEKQTNSMVWEGIQNGADLEVFPNPFSQQTTIRFNIDNDDHATITVYNISGQQVQVIFNKDVEGGYIYQAQFDAQNLPDGIYVYQLITESGLVKTGKMVLRK